MTLYDVIKGIAEHSESVFMYSFDSINKNDKIHKLAGKVKEIQKLNELDELNVFPMNHQAEFNELMLSETIIDDYGDKNQYYGLVCRHNNELAFYKLYALLKLYSLERFKESYAENITIEGVSAEECYYAMIVSHCILDQFYVYRISNLVFLHYLCKCFESSEYYSEKCLENMFLIAFSESPCHREAIQQIRMKNTVKEKILVLKKSNIPIFDVFTDFYSSDIIKNAMSKEFSMSISEIELLIRDMVLILKCFMKVG